MSCLLQYTKTQGFIHQRSGLDEYLTFLAWNSDLLLQVLKKYRERVIEPNFGIFEEKRGLMCSNNRQVCLVNLRELL